MDASVELPERAPTGVAGLDEILNGGLPAGWTYLIHGHAGMGKTTLSLHFLREGVRAGERVLYVSLMQSREELANMARSHGWSLEAIEFLELPESVRKKAVAEQTVFAPNEIQLQELTETIVAGIKEYRPERLVLDSISELAVLAASAQQLRGPVLTVKDLLQDTSCTALFTCGEIGPSTLQLPTLLHGVIELEMSFPSYGAQCRRLKVAKMRGMPYLGGYHDFRIRTGGWMSFHACRPTDATGATTGRPLPAVSRG
jgi:circadian clock protein KaiC